MQSLIEKRLKELLEKEYIHSEVIEDAVYILDPLPDDLIAKANISTDTLGGARFEWENGNKHLRLVITANDNYLYHEHGDRFDGFYHVKTIDIIRWLRWLDK